MNLRTPASVAALLGGLLWVARWVADGSGAADALYWAGLVVVALGVGLGGAALVASGAVPLRVLVGIAAPLLAWSVVSVVRPADPALVDGICGVLAAGLGVLGLASGERRSAPESSAPDSSAPDSSSDGESTSSGASSRRRGARRRAGSHLA